MNKEVVDGEVPEEERHLKINKAEDYVKRAKNIERNQDIVDWFGTAGAVVSKTSPFTVSLPPGTSTIGS